MTFTDPTPADCQQCSIRFQNNGVFVYDAVIEQIGAAVVNVTPTTISTDYLSRQYSINIEANTSWTISADVAWIQFDYVSGERDKVVKATIDANSGDARTGTITVDGDEFNPITISVSQEAYGGPSMSASPLYFNGTAAGGSTQTVNITSNVPWIVQSDQTWLTVSPASGSNNSTLTLTVAANGEPETREAHVTISGNGVSDIVIPLGQNAAAKFLNRAPSSYNFTNAAGSTTIDVTSNISWTVTSNQSWCTVSPSSGDHNGQFTVSVTANSGTMPRTATVSIESSAGTSTVQINQASASYIQPSTTSMTFEGSASSQTFGVNSNTSWYLSSNESWLTVSPTSGTNTQTCSATVTANDTGDTRTATITVSSAEAGNATITVTQDYQEDEAYLTLSEDGLEVNSKSHNLSLDITSNVDWETSVDDAWVSVNQETGYADATIYIDVEAYEAASGASSRVTFVRVQGESVEEKTLRIEQYPVYVDVDLLYVNAGQSGGPHSVNLTANTPWTVQNPQDDVRDVTPTSGTGDATLVIDVAPNNTGFSRTSNININSNDGNVGAKVTIVQSS